MPDATRVFEPGFQVTNSAGTPQSGAVLRFYAAGTSNTRTVYSDSSLSTSLGVTVTTNSAGRPAASAGAGAEVVIYTGTTAYKVTAETSAGVTLWSFDNVIGALDTSSFLTGSVIATTPVIAKTADYTIVSGDKGKIINGNPTGGTFTLTLPSAITVGDGWRVGIRHRGTANNIIVATVSSQTIDGDSTRTLYSQHESVTLVSDGANWNTDGYGIAKLTHGRFFGRTTTGDGPPQVAIVPFGQCQLTKSGVSLLLSPYDGNLLTINSAAEAIPDAGITLSTAGVAASTLNYIYAYMSSGTMTLEPSATAYATQAGTGIKIKSGDATRTLVGLARTDASTAWADTATKRFVRSYYNDPGAPLKNAFTALRSTTSTSFVELNSEIRIEFLVWSGEVAHLFMSGSCYGGTAGAQDMNTAFGLDGTTAETGYAKQTTSSNDRRLNIAQSLRKTGLAEGYHYATMLGAVGSGTGNWAGGGSPSEEASLAGWLQR